MGKFFITGTDTGVGKTVIAAALTLGLSASYWKPIQSGLLSITDTEWVRSRTCLEPFYFLPEAYCLTDPLSPHAAAERDGVEIFLEKIKIPEERELIIEGAGGVLVPLNSKQLMVDLIQMFAIPVIIVARSTLGTINHTLMTVETLRVRQIEIAGVVLNGPKNEGNRRAIEKYGGVTVIGEVEPLEKLNRAALIEIFQTLEPSLN